MDISQEAPSERLKTLVATDPDAIDGYLATLSGAEVVRAMFRLESAERHAILRVVEPETAAEFIEDVPDEVAADLIEALPVEDAASIVTALPSHEQADVLAEVEDEDMDRILGAMAPESAREARELLGYDPESAGGLMVREYLAFGAGATARDVLEELTSGVRDLSPTLLQYAYAVEPDGTLAGVVRTRDLVAAPPESAIGSLMKRPTAVNAEADLATVDACLEESEVLSLPVTDDAGRLLGVVEREHVDDALVERASDDHLKSQGIVGGEELRSMPVAERSGRRLSWLSVNIVLNMVSVSVIAAFEETLAAVIALAVFLPIVSDMSGCSGNQAVAVSMRELTLGVVGPRDALRVWWQEAKVGVLNGLALGVLLGLAAWAWKGNPALGAVVALALALNTVVAVSIGGTVPLLLKRLGADPAVASGPVLTTVTDMCGFFLVLGIATLALGWLQPV
ncbi:MAG: magnesium transporter [Pseudomonadales bacterium]|nr:magnesium transporter [Pseudomonadales bacterium]